MRLSYVVVVVLVIQTLFIFSLLLSPLFPPTWSLPSLFPASPSSRPRAPPTRFPVPLTARRHHHVDLLAHHYSLHQDALEIPDYDPESSTDRACEETFDVDLIASFRKHRGRYCTDQSASQLVCYHQPNGVETKNKDVFCEGTRLKYLGDVDFMMYCQETDEESTPLSLREFPTFMYQTGLGFLLNHVRRIPIEHPKIFPAVRQSPATSGHLKLIDSQIDSEMQCTDIIDTPTFLMKREGAHNIFHCLMEILSFYISAHVLKLTPTGSGNQTQPFQIVFMDKHDSGSCVDLWSLFAPQGTYSLFDYAPNSCFRHVVWPLPGGSNPLWKGFWQPLSCRDSHLFHYLVDEILQFYQLSLIRPAYDSIRITVVTRAKSRRLLDQTAMLEEAQQKLINYPYPIEVEEVDFAGLSLAQQIEISRRSHILVGVHGAGLIHLWWLPPEAVVVEILPPRVNIAVFRNMAKLLGKIYLSVTAKTSALQQKVWQKKSADKETDWHNEDVRVDRTEFIQTLLNAVQIASNFGARMNE